VKREDVIRQLVESYFKDCISVESCILIVKPDCLQHVEAIVRHLQEFRYKLLDRKVLALKELEAQSVIRSLCRFALEARYESYLVSTYSSNEVELLHVAKPAARAELGALLRSFSFEKKDQNVRAEKEGMVSFSELKKMVVPCQSSLAHR